MLSPCELDIHTHTIVSGHAYGTIREMAQAASEKGLKALGFAEHGPGIPGTCHPMYFWNMVTVPRELYGVEILRGVEANVLQDGTVDLEERYLARLDYAIVGIHTLCYKDAGREGNTDAVISCMKNPHVFFVSHPDDDHTPLNYDRLVPAAVEHHVALEVNNSSFRKPDRRLNCVQNYETMTRLCMEHRCPILVSSDAHDPSAVGDHALALEFLDRVGFDPSLIINATVDRLKEFIGYQG